ncbi:DNA-binding protein [Streptomyces sp. NPDC051954]|uniref:DNA-binding protein n=1 Tax=Streptomyces sp. NPDC051954 TaxID=3155524 RepID=UPI0034272C5F
MTQVSTETHALTREELLALPASIDIVTAGRAFGVGRTTAYALARTGEFPCQVIRAGRAYRAITADLLRVLHISSENGDGAGPCTSDAA